MFTTHTTSLTPESRQRSSFTVKTDANERIKPCGPALASYLIAPPRIVFFFGFAQLQAYRVFNQGHWRARGQCRASQHCPISRSQQELLETLTREYHSRSSGVDRYRSCRRCSRRLTSLSRPPPSTLNSVGIETCGPE